MLKSQAVPKEEAIIWARGLTRRFGEEVAVADLNLTIPYGTIFGFIGPSGSGKTTTVRLLTGIHEPSAGEVSVLGQEPILFSRKLRRRIGYMPQLFVLYPDLSINENMNFTASLFGMNLFNRGKRFREVLDFVELTEHRRKLARNISGGMQRRLALAATLVHSPELLFLDEPTAGIDPVLRRKFWDHFGELKAQGRTMFITTQYVNEAAYCDYVGVMAGGRLVALDTPDGLRQTAFGGDIVNLVTEDSLRRADLRSLQELPFVRRELDYISASQLRVTVDEAATDIQKLLEWCASRDITVQSIEEYMPPYDDVFVELVREESADA